jgi:hypothetical protein
VVYEAEDSKLGRKVAPKFLPEDKRRDPETLEFRKGFDFAVRVLKRWKADRD